MDSTILRSTAVNQYLLIAGFPQIYITTAREINVLEKATHYTLYDRLHHVRQISEKTSL